MAGEHGLDCINERGTFGGRELDHLVLRRIELRPDRVVFGAREPILVSGCFARRGVDRRTHIFGPLGMTRLAANEGSTTE